MTSIFSSIAGAFTRTLILSAFLPAAIFGTLWLAFVEPLIPPGRSLLSSLGLFGDGWQTIALLFLGVVLTGLIYSMNIPIIRFFEGYPWKDSWIGRQRTRGYQADYRRLKGRAAGMRSLLRCLKQNDPDYAVLWSEWNRLTRLLRGHYPGKIDRLLPTRLGNTIRSFEYYPEEQYDMEPITLWTRLAAKVDKDYAAGIADAKTSFDFMIHSSLLSAVLALASLLLGLYFPSQGLATPTRALSWLIQVGVFAVISYLFYLGSIPRASAWGEMVKGAFDLYRWDLFKQLGYQQIPKTRRAERDLWDRISLQMVYGDRPEGPRLDYDIPPAAPPISATGKPTDIVLKITRGILPKFEDKGMHVLLEVKNPDPERDVQEVKVTDTLPEGFEYVWGSATRDGSRVDVEGVNPYCFSIGSLAPGETARLSYLTVPRPVLE
jgi:Domain of unknown function DUF11